MRIEHIALYVRNLEKSKAFYETYFGGKSGTRYDHIDIGFSSYFLSFSDGTRLELMSSTGVSQSATNPSFGYAHMAFSVGSEKSVDEYTARLAADGFTVAGNPRRTGDGYYESCVLDPDGNRIEITV